MKKRFKKMTATLLTTAMAMSIGMPAFASTVDYTDTLLLTSDKAVIEELTTNITLIEDNLLQQESSILEELEKGKTRTYNLLQNSTDPEEQQKIIDLVNAYSNMITQYQNYISSIDSGIAIQGVYNPVYSAAVAAVVAYFDSNNYVLSSELLLYAADKSTGGTYRPVNTSVLYSTSIYNTLKQKSSGYTTSDLVFSGGSTTAEMDAHYSINKCDCSVTASTIIIEDCYDFDYDAPWTSLAGIAINTMSTAQFIGVLVPYDVYITLNK